MLDCLSGHRSSNLLGGHFSTKKDILKYHFVYKTTHTSSGKYYIGVHSTDNLEDGYLGSGLIIKNSIAVYGSRAFTRTIIKHFSTREDAFLEESLLVTKELIDSDVFCLNLKPGGFGGWGPTSQKHKETTLAAGRKTQKWLRENDPEWVAKNFQARSESVSSSYKVGTRTPRGWSKEDRICAQSEESRARRIKTFSVIGHAKGEKNSQFGTCWVSDSKETKKIPLSLLDDYISLGYRRGRKLVV